MTQTIHQPGSQMAYERDNGLLKSSSILSGGIPQVLEIPKNTIIALDVHGTLISRDRADDLRVVERFRQMISEPAKDAGAKVVVVSAAPTRELQRVASLLDLGDQPAVAELGHDLMPSIVEAPPRLAPNITPAIYGVLLDLKRWLVQTGLPPGVFLEPKTVLVSLNWSQAPSERDGLVASMEGYIGRHEAPLYVSVFDATLDVGVDGINKASGLSSVINGLGLGTEEIHILAIGDSRNDMDLLKVSFPGLCGCPANSHLSVKDYVNADVGIVSEYPNLAGTLDALAQLIERAMSYPELSQPDDMKYIGGWVQQTGV